jgi:hypothetical protein
MVDGIWCIWATGDNFFADKADKDLNIKQVAQAGKIIEELFLDWDEYPSLSEDEAAGPA